MGFRWGLGVRNKDRIGVGDCSAGIGFVLGEKFRVCHIFLCIPR